MSKSTVASTFVEVEGVTLDATFAYRASARALHVRYRVRNTGETAIAIFDRGDMHAVLTGRQQAGAIPAPVFEEQAGGDVTLSHIALALAKPSPYSPPVPLAIKLAAGAESSGEFEFGVPTQDAPKRLRWCLGIAPFAAAQFTSPERVNGVEIWRASFAVVDSQEILCTPWFDVDRGAFAS